MAKRRGIVGEFAEFIWERKLFWMLPIIIVTVLLALIVALSATGGGAVAPFIYTIF